MQTSSFSFEVSREKWREVPADSQNRVFTSDLMQMNDSELLLYWEQVSKDACHPKIRGGYQQWYKNVLAGKKVLDIGSGLGFDGIFFASHGAQLTFADIHKDNLDVLERLCKLKNIEAKYYYIDSIEQFFFPHQFDVLLCIGSLINSPFHITAKEVAALLPFLSAGGKVLFLGYPYERFAASETRDGAEFGKTTDGKRTPWVEWYDKDKVLSLFGQEFTISLCLNFGAADIEFNFFELTQASSRENFRKISTSIVHPIEMVQTLPIETNTVESCLQSFVHSGTEVRHLEFVTWKNRKKFYCGKNVHIWNIENPLAWDDGGYPHSFFDSAVINGGYDIDTARLCLYKTLRLIRPGGIIIICDFVLFSRVANFCDDAAVMTSLVLKEYEYLKAMCDETFLSETGRYFCLVRNATEISQERIDYIRKYSGMPAAVPEEKTIIFSKDKSELDQILEYNPSRLTSEGVRIPSHTTTPFFFVPLSKKALVVNLTFLLEEETPPFICEVQDDLFKIIFTARSKADDEITWTEKFLLPANTFKIRLCLKSGGVYPYLFWYIAKHIYRSFSGSRK